ncbi:MAG: diaminobutyrate acetyltransferase [Oleibacter sp.]|nr:diaminobutyrate acetyltransferase [Thalassolituus sp.]
MDPYSTTSNQKNVTAECNFSFRKPVSTDGSDVFALVERCKPLDVNSMYCNLLQCSHFADTAIVAERGGQMVGFISGYRLPQQPDVLFVWQVAVDAPTRGQGLASQMLMQLLIRLGGQVQHLHTTITPDNQASWKTFQRLAATLNAPLNDRDMFDREQHFNGEHETEKLVHIGPFDLAAIADPALQARAKHTTQIPSQTTIQE